MSDELEGMATFVAVAETGGFRRAAERLGITGSAVSQTIRRLEARLGVPLVQRTTRSVRLTEAGERLYASARPALDELRAAAANVGEYGEVPAGVLRLHTSTVAESTLFGALLTGFLSDHAQVRLDLVVSDAAVDIVAGRFDAGIQLGEVIDKDMIAIPLTGDLRLAVVGAPSYFARHPIPQHPRDLVEHECLNLHATDDAPPYRWEFTENGRAFSVAVPARVLATDASLNRRLAIAGLGITLSFESHVRDAIQRGQLVSVLKEFCAPFPGYYLYYPQRRQASRPLRALVDYVRRAKRARRVRQTVIAPMTEERAAR
jgi:DNA-binding transcriptional LysR family regulator